jgi:hypothetical protein
MRSALTFILALAFVFHELHPETLLRVRNARRTVGYQR